MSLELVFHGAAGAVTGSCMELRGPRHRVLIDCGLFQGSRALEALNYEPLPFDPRDPVHTPRQLKVNDPQVAALLRQALAGAVQDARDAGLDPEATLGQLQAFQAGTQPVPIHGAPEHLGIYNVIESSADGNGHLVPLTGTSYVQAVAFDGGGPRARALLSYSQSADPASPHYADQTQRFARKDWIALPFTEQAMRADPEYRTLRISGP